MLSDEHKKIINYAVSYIGNSTTDWFKIKRELVKIFPPKERSNFSRRHFSTKKQLLNKFDREVIKYWEKQTKLKLFIDQDKLHPKDWVRKPKGHGLKAYNEKRKNS